MTEARIVSLVPSLTETLVAWGITPVACTRFCEQPLLPSVGGTKDPNIDSIMALEPDLVLVNDEENRREDHDDLVAAGLDVHVVRVGALSDVGPALAELAERLDVAAPTIELIPARPPAVRVFVPIWKRPWMTIGSETYGASLLAHLGAVNVVDDPKYPEIALEEVASLRPDLVLAPSEPYPFSERHRAVLEQVAPVRFVDGQDLFWWGARTPDAVRRLGEQLG